MTIRRILLVNPPVTRPADFSAEVVRVSAFFPLGLAYLAAAIEREDGYTVSVLDALIQAGTTEHAPSGGIRYGMTDGQIAREIAEYKPDVVGVSCLFAAMEQDALNICHLAKSLNGDCVTVLGGADAGANGAELMDACPELDVVLIGEAEHSIVQLLNALNHHLPMQAVDGAYWREAGTVRHQPKTHYITDLDTLPFPARHLFDMSDYLTSAMAHSVYRREPFTQMITSRGCPCKCTFCALGRHWGPKQRTRSAENVLDEIEMLISNYGIREIHFEDDNLTGDKKRALKIFNGMIERGFDLTWNVPSGMAVYTLDDELLDRMVASGCYSVSLAIESGDQNVLRKLMHKPVNLERVPPLVRQIRRLGMDARGFFILGFPGETKQTIRRTVDFARSCELDWAYFFIASPLPHTEMWDTCIKNGYIREEDFDPVRSFHQSIIHTPEFDPDDLASIREDAIIDVNFANNPNLRKYDIDKAITSFADVVAKYPHFAFANFYLAEAYRRKGLLAEARNFYQAALEADDSYILAAQRLDEMETT